MQTYQSHLQIAALFRRSSVAGRSSAGPWWALVQTRLLRFSWRVLRIKYTKYFLVHYRCGTRLSRLPGCRRYLRSAHVWSRSLMWRMSGMRACRFAARLRRS